MTRHGLPVRLGWVAGGGAVMIALALAITNAQTKSTSDTYLDKCSVCHGADGAAKTAKGRKLKVKDVNETVVKMTAEQMIDVVVKGKTPDMDAYGKEFSADQIGQLVAYYRGLAKPAK